MSLEGRAVIVTGAASGIGLATTASLAAAGARVTGVDVAEEPLRSASDRLETVSAHVLWRVADVTDFKDMAGTFREVVEREGRIDALIGCAGVADVSSIHNGDPDRWREVLAVNALGPMVSARVAVPHMLKQGFGDIIIVTSASGRITYVGEPAYVASKHAAVAFLDSMRKELAGTDIRITSIEPGLVDTPMSRAHPFLDSIPESFEPLRPTDIAELIVYCLGLPKRLSINEVVIRPTQQEL